MKILLIEDERVQRMVIENLFEGTDHEVLVAENGEEGWKIIQETGVRMIITDWIMPVLSGPELIQRIRKADLPGYSYVILLSAQDSTDNIVEGLEAGADDYMTKPFSAAELMARLKIGQRILTLQERLHDLATRDPLTGLMNRRAFLEGANAEYDRALRGRSPLAAAMIDIDGFKAINDLYGHETGDRAIQSVAEALRLHRRTYDLLCRWGGEEFLVLMPGCDAASAAAAAERVRVAIGSAVIDLPGGGGLRMTVSIGVAVGGPGANPRMEELIHRADTSMYKAKKGGKDRVCAE